MTRITIPRETEVDRDLVAVPRDTYREFLAWQRAIKSRRTFVPTASEKRSLAKARKNLLQGKYHPVEILRYDVASRR